jgi:hypothetical protein
MKATDLQHRLAHLKPGETLLLSAAKIEQAFPSRPTRAVWLTEVTNLAWWYRCSLMLSGPGESEILFIRHDTFEAADL